MHPDAAAQRPRAPCLHPECTLVPTRVHPICTQNATATAKTGSQHEAFGSKTLVVEHKGCPDVAALISSVLSLCIRSRWPADQFSALHPANARKKAVLFGIGAPHSLFFEGAVTNAAGRFTFALQEALDAEISQRREPGLRPPQRICQGTRSSMNSPAGGDNLIGAEERLAATIEQVRRELFRLGRAQQALFAYVDSLAKVLLTCIPEPPQDVREQAIARARERHNRLVKSAGSAMVGDSQAAMQDLVSRVEK